MDYKIRKKLILGLFISILVVYNIFYLTMLFKGEFHEHHKLFLLGIILFLTLSVLFISLPQKVKMLYYGCIALIITTIFEFVYEIINLDYPFLDINFHIISSIALVLFVIGIYQVVIHNQKHKQISLLSYEQNEAFYIEYIVQDNKMLLEFSDLFMNKYGISQKKVVINSEIFKSYLHPGDLIKFAYFEKAENPSKTKINYRIKFPEMKQYVFIHNKSLRSNGNFIALSFDISEYEGIDRIIGEQTKAYNLLELERRKIVESSRDLVGKFSPDGTIIYASSNYAKLYNLDEQSIIGRNIFALDKARNCLDDEWFYKTLDNHYFRGQGKEIFNGKEIWISWHNDVLLDEAGNVEYLISVGRDITELVKLNQELASQSLHDHTTGLLNNRGLYEAVEALDNVNTAVSFFIDVKNFSTINDYYGNETGDIILKQIANELKYYAYNQIVARYSGDKFVVVCVNSTPAEIDSYLVNFKLFLKSIYNIEHTKIQVGKKIGYAIYPDDTDSLSQLISLSSLAKSEIYDHNLLEIQSYRPYMSAKLNSNINMAIRLKQALQQKEIEIYFQKIINVKNNEVSYIEALARWQDKEKGFVSPEYFFNIAKQSGIIHQLDEYIFEKAIAKYAKLRKEPEFKNSILTLNIAPSTLLQENIPQLLENISKRHKIKPQYICIEISENTFVHNIGICKRNIENFKLKGFLIALDDFGREYSSLSILDSIEVDSIKIDGAFVRNIYKPQNQAIVQMIMNISELTRKVIIAECVETDKESKILTEMKCYLQQGFYFHKPEKL